MQKKYSVIKCIRNGGIIYWKSVQVYSGLCFSARYPPSYNWWTRSCPELRVDQSHRECWPKIIISSMSSIRIGPNLLINKHYHYIWPTKHNRFDANMQFGQSRLNLIWSLTRDCNLVNINLGQLRCDVKIYEFSNFRRSEFACVYLDQRDRENEQICCPL